MIKRRMNDEIISQSNGIGQRCENQRLGMDSLCGDAQNIRVCGDD